MAKKKQMSRAKRVFWIVILTVVYIGAVIFNFYNYGRMGTNFWAELEWVLILQAGWNLLVLTLLYASILFVILSAGKIRKLEEANEDKREDVLTIMARYSKQEKQGDSELNTEKNTELNMEQNSELNTKSDS